MTLDVATFSQIMTLLTQLSTNYTNIFTDYYNIFLNPTPMDVTLQLFDQDGNLQTIVIPNRAKDRQYILNGEGDPNGNISGNRGSIYQDLENGAVYINLDSDIDGWSKIVDESELATYIKQGAGSPEGIVTGTKGLLYIDNENSGLYMKTTASGTNGWTLISKTIDLFANVDLTNLSEEGEAHFVNPALSNLSTMGQAKFDAKEDVSNKISTITASSTAVDYPSAKAVYDFSEGKENKSLIISSSSTDIEYPSAAAVYRLSETLANNDLSNLTNTGENHFANKFLNNLNSTGVNKILPSQTDNNGKFLTTDGTSPSWVTLPANDMPDYSAAVSKSLSTNYTADVDGYISFVSNIGVSGYGISASLSINGVTRGLCYGAVSGTTSNWGGSFFVPIAKGDIYSVSCSVGGSLSFVPLKGSINN